MRDIFQIRPAAEGDFGEIIGMIGGAAGWLRETKAAETGGQWLRPWPDRESRDKRIIQGIANGDTWIVEEDDRTVATITYRAHGNGILWTQQELAELGVYISRLIVKREHARRGIGAALIDWAGQHGLQEWDARWIRVDVWTNNHLLHKYYRDQGFTYLRTQPFADPWQYPSAALFQKETERIDEVAAASFKEVG
jgi:ribosomal protein S18 acetylase RimI-like enzyme